MTKQMCHDVSWVRGKYIFVFHSEIIKLIKLAQVLVW